MPTTTGAGFSGAIFPIICVKNESRVSRTDRRRNGSRPRHDGAALFARPARPRRNGRGALGRAHGESCGAVWLIETAGETAGYLCSPFATAWNSTDATAAG